MTAMIPASLRMKRANPTKPKRLGAGLDSIVNAAPRLTDGNHADDTTSGNVPSIAGQIKSVTTSRPRGVFDSKYEDFMLEMADLGALQS